MEDVVVNIVIVFKVDKFIFIIELFGIMDCVGKL